MNIIIIVAIGLAVVALIIQRSFSNFKNSDHEKRQKEMNQVLDQIDLFNTNNLEKALEKYFENYLTLLCKDKIDDSELADSIGLTKEYTPIFADFIGDLKQIASADQKQDLENTVKRFKSLILEVFDRYKSSPDLSIAYFVLPLETIEKLEKEAKNSFIKTRMGSLHKELNNEFNKHYSEKESI